MKIELTEKMKEDHVRLLWVTKLLRTSFAHLAKMGPPGNEYSCGPGCSGPSEDDCPRMRLTIEEVRKELYGEKGV